MPPRQDASSERFDTPLNFALSDGSSVRGGVVIPEFSVERKQKTIVDANGNETVFYGDDNMPVYEDIYFIRLSIANDPTTKVRRRMQEADKRKYAEHWNLFVNGENQRAADGTPIEEMPGVTRRELGLLSYHDILSIETLAAIDETMASSYGVADLRHRARNWLEKARGGAEENSMAARLAAMERGLAQMQQRAEAAERKSEGLQTALDALGVGAGDDEGESPAPRAPAKKRGRKKAAPRNSVEASNPNAMSPDDIASIGAAADDDDNPLAAGSGDVVDNLIES